MKISKTNVSFLGQKVLPIEGIEKTCNFYSLKSDENTLDFMNHHVLLVDVSESMRDNIQNLKKGLKETLRALRKDGRNYVSIILYSDNENVEVIVSGVKCEDTSYRLNKVYKKVEENVYARKNTVLSKALEESRKIINSLEGEGIKHHILLFTDGYISDIQHQKQERSKCFKEIENLKKDKISVSTIGLGAYYDKEFLREITIKSYNGRFNHISDIKDYYKTAINEIKRTNNSEDVDLEITNDKFFILEQRKLVEEDYFIRSLNLESENLVVVFDEELVVNDKTIKVTNKTLNSEFVDDFLYGLARYYVENDDVTNMETILSISGDEDAYNKLVNSNSFIEKGMALEFLEELINDRSKRFRLGKKTTNIENKRESMCLLELLYEIMNDSDCKLLWDYSYKYKRIGVKEHQIEDTYKFKRPTSGFGEVTDITIGGKKLNIGVKVKIDGVVQNEVNKLKLDAAIYRDYNLVVDGNINTDEIWCILSKNAKARLRREKLLKKVIKVYDKEICVINLKNIKLTNKRMKKLIDEYTITQYLYDLELMNCDIWAMEKFLNEIFGGKEKQYFSDGLTEEERKVRQEFRIDSKGIYSPLRVEKDNNTPYEFYVSKVVEWKIHKFPKTKARKEALERCKTLIFGEMNESYKRLLNKLDELNYYKKHLQTSLNIVKIANRLDNNKVFIWDEIEEKRKTQTDFELGKNMVVSGKATVGIKNMNGIKIREDFYEVINKYN